MTGKYPVFIKLAGRLFVASLLSFTLSIGFAQQKFYEDSFKGGVTVGGYSPGAATVNPGSFSIQIAAGSSIRKAYLMAGRQGNAPATTITLNGINYTFDMSNQVSSTFQSPSYGGASAVHAIDVTAYISPAINNYSFSGGTLGSSDRFADFLLYVAYENAGLQTVNTAIFLNNNDFDTSMVFSLALANPIHTAYDAGLSFFCGYLCNSTTDGETAYVNTTNIGMMGNNDINSGVCGGPIGSFYYQDAILKGLNDDNENLSVSMSDALSNIKTIIPNGTQNLSIDLVRQAPMSGASPTAWKDNAVWGIIMAYGGNCNNALAQAGSDTSVCQGQQAKLQASGGNNYSWKPASGLSNPNISAPVANPSVTTIYTVAITDALGCSGSDSIMVQVTPLPIANAGKDTSVCAGNTIYLNATSNASQYGWNAAQGLTDTSSLTPSVSPVSTGYYHFNASDKGCITRDSVQVKVFPAPTAFAGNDSSVCKDSSFYLSATGGISYAWQPTTGLSSPDSSVTLASLNTSTYFTVTVTDINGCSDNDEVFMNITDCETEICNNNTWFLPNSFSPNNDGMNDNLELRTPNLECIVKYHLTIYDRWGEKVFESHEPLENWDGQWHNNMVDPAVYHYFLSIIWTDNSTEMAKGNVILIK